VAASAWPVGLVGLLTFEAQADPRHQLDATQRDGLVARLAHAEFLGLVDEARERGIDLLEAAVENSSGVVEAVQSTIARGAEVIFIPGDTTVASACDSVVEVAGKAGVPVFTLVPGRPDRGTFFDVGYDFREVGLLAGRLAGDLLAGRDPAGVPIGETAREIPPRLTVNLTAPGVDPAVWRVPDELLTQAKVVIETGGRREQPEAVLQGPFDEAGPPPQGPPRHDPDGP